MGERLTPWKPTCNGAVHVQLSGDATTSDAGSLVLREALDTSGVIDAMTSHLNDSRDPLRVRHSLALQLRITVLQRAMGWSDLADTQVLRHDPLWRFACSDARGLTPLETKHPSQATLSRLITCLSRPDNLDTVHEGLLRLAIWRLNSLPTVTSYTNDTPLTLDIDGLPIEVFGHQDGSAYNGYAGTLIYAALQQCWNDDRLIAADRLWAISHIQYQYVIMACFLVLYGIPVMPKIARGSRSTPT